MMEVRYFKRGEETCSYNCEDGKILATIEINGRWWSNPTITFFCSETGFVEYTPEPPAPVIPTRSEKINSEIRERYTENDEFMVLRQYAANPSNPAYKTAFDEYNAYVESILAKYPEEDE